MFPIISDCFPILKTIDKKDTVSYLYFLEFRDHLIQFGVFENGIPLKPLLGAIDSAALFITVNEQSESSPEWSFHSSIVSFASGRSYHPEFINLNNCFCLTSYMTEPLLGASEVP